MALVRKGFTCNLAGLYFGRPFGGNWLILLLTCSYHCKVWYDRKNAEFILWLILLFTVHVFLCYGYESWSWHCDVICMLNANKQKARRSFILALEHIKWKLVSGNFLI